MLWACLHFIALLLQGGRRCLRSQVPDDLRLGLSELRGLVSTLHSCHKPVTVFVDVCKCLTHLCCLELACHMWMGGYMKVYRVPFLVYTSSCISGVNHWRYASEHLWGVVVYQVVAADSCSDAVAFTVSQWHACVSVACMCLSDMHVSQ
jgi:hypothetical protein